MKLVTTAIVALFATAAFAAGTGTATGSAAAPAQPEATKAAPGKEMAKETKTEGCTGKHGKALKKCEAEMKKNTTTK